MLHNSSGNLCLLNTEIRKHFHLQPMRQLEAVLANEWKEQIERKCIKRKTMTLMNKVRGLIY